MKIINKKLKNNKAFVMLFAVVLSSIILAVTLGVANIALKELNFTTSAKSTNDAFFAADAGVECALYYDLVGAQSYNGIINPFGAPPTSVNTYCAGTAVDLSVGTGTQINPWTFYVYPLGASGKACAVVKVYKTTNPDTTNIVSRGYDTGGDTSSNCYSTNSNRVERQIEVNY